MFEMEVGVLARVAEQLAVVPPFAPVQLHAHGPVPVTLVAVPTLQRFAVGAAESAIPFALPHTPFTIDVPDWVVAEVAAVFAEVFPAAS